MNIPVFDLHCDTATTILGNDCCPIESLRRRNGHIDLERGAALTGYAQVFAIFTTPDMDPNGVQAPEEIASAAIKNLLDEISCNQDLIAQATTPTEIQTIVDSGKISAILSIEGPAGIGFDPERLSEMYDFGVRLSTLGWNENNVLTGSHKAREGLTDLGRAYVRECQRLGILVDVSHISDRGFWDIMDMTQAPIVASHSNSRRICDVSRNLTDEMFRAICNTGGTVGINLYTEFLKPGRATLDDVCDHIFHFLEMDPDGKHISLGGDLDGCDCLPDGIHGIQNYDKLVERLLERGITREIVHNIFWNNAMGVMERAVQVNKK